MRTAITSKIPDEAQLTAFVDYLHTAREDERVALARKIHDELGGYLVSAAMDIGWVESHSPGADVLSRLRRTAVSLASAIDMKRDIIEHLRPSLLDNFGLFEALRWYFKHARRRTEAKCTDHYPPSEIALPPQALSHLFRASETLLECTFTESDLTTVDLSAEILHEGLCIKISHEHAGLESVDVLVRFHNELRSTAHRLKAFRGELSFDKHEKGCDFYVEIPLQGLRPDSALLPV
jgi:two-component system, NarL family, sensor histidine kinase UhpB